MSPYSSVLSTERAIADNCVPGLEPGVRPVNVGRNVLGFKYWFRRALSAVFWCRCAHISSMGWLKLSSLLFKARYVKQKLSSHTAELQACSRSYWASQGLVKALSPSWVKCGASFGQCMGKQCLPSPGQCLVYWPVPRCLRTGAEAEPEAALATGKFQPLSVKWRCQCFPVDAIKLSVHEMFWTSGWYLLYMVLITVPKCLHWHSRCVEAPASSQCEVRRDAGNVHK